MARDEKFRVWRAKPGAWLVVVPGWDKPVVSNSWHNAMRCVAWLRSMLYA